MKAIRIHEPVGVKGLSTRTRPSRCRRFGDLAGRGPRLGFMASELYGRSDRPQRHQRTASFPARSSRASSSGSVGPAGGRWARVYGLTDAYRDGAAAELIAVEARDVAPKPTSVDHVHAAALPQAALTSWQALFTHGGLTAGQTVVIHGVAGAVGSIAIQLARTVDARVIATGRAGHRSLALELGADDFVDLEAGRLGEGRRPGRPRD